MSPLAAVQVPGLPTSATLLRWSDPNSWPTHTVPAAGQDVVVPPQDTIVLDESTPALGAVTIQGTLVADTGMVALRASRVDVFGRLQAGTTDQPYSGHFTITLLERPNDASDDTKGIVVHGGGQLELHGVQRVMWTHLAADAPAGAQQLQLADPVDWRAGDRIVVAPSGFDYTQVDLATVRSGATHMVTLTQPLKYGHSGTVQVAGGVSVDERAEVGLLTHDILIQGDSASETNGHGGHIMVLYGGSAHVDGVELYRMGQRGHMGRYPFHWHLAGSVPGQYIRNSSVWHSFNRCTTVHGTDDALVQNNVCFDHAGHGYFVEDGIETNNTFKHNFVTYSRPGSLLPSDDTPSSFWIANPNNNFIDNVAGGSQGPGFWYTPPVHPTGPSATNAVWPAYTPLGVFDGNVAHSSGDGIHLEEDHRDAIPGTGFDPGYFPRTNGDPSAAPVTSVFKHATVYATPRGFWIRGDHPHIDSSVFADNGNQIMMGNAGLVVDGAVTNSVIVGRTGNPFIPTVYRTTGVLLYDGPVTVSHDTFANFTGSMDAVFGSQNSLWVRVSARFAADHVSLVDTRPAYMPAADDHFGFGTVRDLDGTLTGKAGTTIVPNYSYVSDSSCTVVADWNAQLCTAPYVAVGMLGTYDLTGMTILKDGQPVHTWTGTNGPDFTIPEPANHTYEFQVPNLTSSWYALAIEGLPGSNTITTVTPWADSTVRVIVRGAKPDTLVQASSLTALNASATTTAFLDTAAHKVYVRVVGPVAPQAVIEVKHLQQ